MRHVHVDHDETLWKGTFTCSTVLFVIHVHPKQGIGVTVYVEAQGLFLVKEFPPIMFALEILTWLAWH